MMKKLVLILIGLIVIIPSGGCGEDEKASIGMAVEFTDHAACAYISQDKGWYEEEGLQLTAYESYATGMALASALARGDIQVAYICLVPAINAYANAGVQIKVVAGTHKCGYGLVVNPEKIQSIEVLEEDGIRIGCVQEGGAADVILKKTLDKYNLDKDKILSKVQRMNPAKQLLAIQSEQLDAAFLPEQWATMAEDFGFEMMLTTQDVWPQMQGSVLVVKEELIKEEPETVRKLVSVSRKATDWINENPGEAAEIMAQELTAVSEDIFPTEVAALAAQLEIMESDLLASMARMEYTLDIDIEMVQSVIDYMAELGYIQSSFDASEILDLSFLEDELD
jgi:NitT/TauT family transport system substrate-binding protein